MRRVKGSVSFMRTVKGSRFFHEDGKRFTVSFMRTVKGIFVHEDVDKWLALL
jgi:hypothetical protein